MKKKEEFIRKLHQKIDEWDAEIDRMSIKAAQVEEDSRVEFYEQIAELKSKRMQIEETLEKIQQSGEEAWGDLKAGVDLALETMNDALRSAAARFK
ncbi:hypothetical protein [Desulfopila inferna]|uniref:hypothetical protein n=1 Tax=Desulfopila inferna TaxID=468528 RepID=UPI0019623613|nr:hypothetical protein [Desulfopila inferna]MBM9603845.1 hypothetical protein [Desulfopila inferna]